MGILRISQGIEKKHLTEEKSFASSITRTKKEGIRLLSRNISGRINTRKKKSYSKDNIGIRIYRSIFNVNKLKLEVRSF